MEKAMAPHSSTLAWKIPWTEEPGGLQSMGSPRVGHDWAIFLSLFTFMHWRRKWQPTPVFLPGESQGQGSLVGCRLWVAQSRTRLKWLSSSSRYMYVHTHTHTFKFALPICYGWGNKMTMLLENRRFIKSHKILQEPRKSIPYLHGCIFETSSVYYLISSKSYILKNWHFRKQD